MVAPWDKCYARTLSATTFRGKCSELWVADERKLSSLPRGSWMEGPVNELFVRISWSTEQLSDVASVYLSCNNSDYIIDWTHNDNARPFFVLFVLMKPPSQCHRGMSSIQNLLNPEACLSSSCESVGFTFVRHFTIDPLCSSQADASRTKVGRANIA